MPSKAGRQKLIDIRDNIVLARQWAAGLTLAGLSNDRLRLYAVTRALEIISEASRGLDAETKLRHPELPWADIAGAGNVYRHDYEEVSDPTDLGGGQRRPSCVVGHRGIGAWAWRGADGPAF
jgi:uncharacterized protein with HEPN domain